MWEGTRGLGQQKVKYQIKSIKPLQSHFLKSTIYKRSFKVWEASCNLPIEAALDKFTISFPSSLVFLKVTEYSVYIKKLTLTTIQDSQQYQ